MSKKNPKLTQAEKARRYDQLVLFPEQSMDLFCSFCGKSQYLVDRLVTSRIANICNECIEICNEIMEEFKAHKEETNGND